ncbi:MAG TPA: LamG-like jellyroll fold domain-containing protein [Flavobacteriales bacterium]|nr:LamG-like jellyroll fold domain-containing protein [Flavobacteriales bacterium]
MKKSLLILLFIPTLCFGQGSENTLSFNGTDSYVDLGNQVATGVRTIELWFSPNVTLDASSVTSYIALVVRDFNYGDGASTNEFTIQFASDAGDEGKLRFASRNGSTSYSIDSDNNSWTAGEWYHVAGVIDPVTGMALYINGIKQTETQPANTTAIAAMTSAPSDNVSIGRWGALNIRYFNGKIDEARFWTTARTQAEIRDKMCSKLTGSEPGLRAYYDFDNTSGTTLTDVTSNTYHGTLYNFTTSPWIYSGAPVGDISEHLYLANWSTANGFELSSGLGDSLGVENCTGTTLGVEMGVHIYRVGSLPNSLTGTTASVNTHYYGVFRTDYLGTFEVDYTSNTTNCIDCSYQLSRRDANDDMSWTGVDTLSSCSFAALNESGGTYPYRAEYYVGKVSCVGVNEYDFSAVPLYIYPNPASESVTVDLGGTAETSEMLLSVYDITGKVIYAKNVQPNTKTVIGTGAFTNGIYKVTVGGKHKLYTAPLAIIR